MPIHTETDRTKQVTIQTVTGSVSFDECMEAMKAFYSGEPTLHVIWDFSDGTLAEVSSAYIEKIADFVAPASAMRKGGKTAGVVANEVDFGLGRMFSVLAEMRGYEPEVKLFRNLSEAMEWVSGTESEIPPAS